MIFFMILWIGLSFAAMADPDHDATIIQRAGGLISLAVAIYVFVQIVNDLNAY